ncbi:hypothetical protein BANRA_05503 [Klebsiella pneumoniae]|nr:hypothetical protein BANRA_05503 [Klebsiella pneumoniae]
MQINSSNLAEVKSHFPAITWRELAYDACASFWVGTWWLHRKIIDRKGNVFEGIADYNSKTPRVRANYIFKFMERYNRRLQRNGKMMQLNAWTGLDRKAESSEVTGKLANNSHQQSAILDKSNFYCTFAGCLVRVQLWCPVHKSASVYE